MRRVCLHVCRLETERHRQFPYQIYGALSSINRAQQYTPNALTYAERFTFFRFQRGCSKISAILTYTLTVTAPCERGQKIIFFFVL